MSNCIKIRDGQLVFTPNEAFCTLYNDTRGDTAPPGYGRDNLFWWFIPTFRPVPVPGIELAFKPGTGRSSHTWRDFKSIITTLHELGCNPRGSFRYADEFDDFDADCYTNVESLIAEWNTQKLKKGT